MKHTVTKAFYGLCACFSASIAAPAVNATYDWYHWQTQQQAANDPNTVSGDVVTNPGAYDTFVIGEDIEFNACSATFAGYSLCDLPDTQKFVIQWQAKTLNEQGQIQYYDSGVCSAQGQASNQCLNVTIPGNTQSQVFNSSTFYIGLHVVTYSNYYIPLPGGGYAYTGQNGQDPGWVWSGALTRSEANNTGNGGGPSPVPEPLAPFVLVPALAYVIRREYLKKRKPTQAV